LLKDIITMVDWTRFEKLIRSERHGLQSSSLRLCSRTVMPHLIAYGKMTKATWVKVLSVTETRYALLPDFYHYIRCLLLSALNTERLLRNEDDDIDDDDDEEDGRDDSKVPAPFDLVVNFVERHPPDVSKLKELQAFLIRRSRKELAGLATVKCDDPVLLSDILSLWEIFFLPCKGLAYKDKETRTYLRRLLGYDAWKEIILDLFGSCKRDCKGVSSLSSVSTHLGHIRKFFRGLRVEEKEDAYFWEIITDVLEDRYSWQYFSRPSPVWLTEVGKSLLREIYLI